ncbi:aldo/keto reductase [Amycolatopsis thailandensis]|uniref:aldo/keto reductase n=1 Tax=Amycolatopsis thailandensis TaxID=589330 RepID=UPI00365DB923
MSESYGAADWDGGLATIDRALGLGVTFLDTADAYGTGHNEVLVGRAIDGRRERVPAAGPLDAGGEGFPAHQPSFAGEAGEANEKIARTVREVADRLGATPAQVALGLGVRPGRAARGSGGNHSGHPQPRPAGAERGRTKAGPGRRSAAALDPLSSQVTGERYTSAHTAEVARG